MSSHADTDRDPRKLALTHHLEESRRRLLDLTNRNRLLNFRHSDSSRTHIRVIDELPEILHETLGSGRALTFRPVAEPAASSEDQRGAPRLDVADQARRAGLNPEFDLPPPAPSSAHPQHVDRFIQTLHFPTEMERKLTGIQTAARTALEETGAHTLYAAFGFLEWQEAGADTSLLAPLLLHPVEISRKLRAGIYEFTLSSADEETQTNLSLAERIKRDFGWVLPSLDEGEGPESYFAKITAAVAAKPKWRVRRFITFGIFAFARLVMYRDLAPQAWPTAHPLSAHPILLDLFGGRAHDQAAANAPTEDVDVLENAGKAPLFIADADSSQASAVIDALGGRSLVIQGPPGTGKSQTITNLIGAALDQGKRVLFVAEKRAALDVVKKRLDDAKLGDFCLELHSVKAKKKDVVEALAQRLNSTATHTPRELGERLAELSDLRQKLNAYCDTLRQPVGACGMVVHELLGRAERTRRDAVGLPSPVTTVALPSARSITVAQISEARRTLQILGEREAAMRRDLLEDGDHPWGLVRAEGLLPNQRRMVIACVRAADEAVACIESALAVLASPSWTIAGAQRIVATSETLPADLDADDAVLTHVGTSSDLQTLDRWLWLLEVQSRLTSQLRRAIPEPSEALRHREAFATLAALADRAQATDTPLSALAHHAAAHRREAREIERLQGHAEKLAAATRVADTTIGALRRVLRAADAVDKTERSVLLLRNAGVVAEASATAIEAASTRAKRARALTEQLSPRLRVPLDAQPEVVRNHGRALRSAGFFAWVTQSYRDATAFYRLHSTGTKQTRATMAADLETAAESLALRGSLGNDEKLRIACGESFSGADTDFDALLRVNSWACDIRRSLPPTDKFGRALRDVVLHGDLEILDAILALTNADAGLALAETLARASDEDADLASTAARVRAEAELCERIAEHSQALGLATTLRVGEIHEFFEALSQLQRSNEELAALATGEKGRAFARASIDGLRRARELANVLLGAGFDAEVLAALFAHMPSETARALVRKLPELRRALGELAEAGSRLEPLGLASEQLLTSAQPLSAIRHALGRALLHSAALDPWLDFADTRAGVRQSHVEPLVRAYEASGLAFRRMLDAYESSVCDSLVTLAYETWPLLRTWSGLDQEHAAARFRELDREILQLQQSALAAKLHAVHPDTGIGSGPRREWTGIPLIRNEIGKKMRHLPIRQLMERAGAEIAALMPCFMMSPMSVAQFLAPDVRRFDVVIMDEASQMRPEDALGAIARGAQLIVVGDHMQLPPTTFFERLEADEDTGNDDEQTDEKLDAESILDLARAIYHPIRDLRWHYRSRHASLISFSNAEFYQGRLRVFPSPTLRAEDLGVRLVAVAGDYATSENPAEARRVAEEIARFARTHPKRSLGVAAMNQKQRELIESMVDELARKDSELEAYRESWKATLEPFFIKNLENVQGDERDVIFVSMTYGPDPTGKLHQRFGPVNGAHGHRRLNVLFTRAKEQLVVFSSMRPAQIHVDDKSAWGVRALRAYLEFAEHGRLPARETTSGEIDNDFERLVADDLRAAGWQTVPQVGAQGFWVDIGVVHPSRPTEFLCGVECDGATYHSSRSARDRDRLREEILHRLGWRIVRVWSTDWFANPAQASKRLVESVRRLAEASDR